MNLAEIRKKAGVTKITDEEKFPETSVSTPSEERNFDSMSAMMPRTKDSSHSVSTSSEERDFDTGWSSGLPEADMDFDDDYPPVPEIANAALPGGADRFQAPDFIDNETPGSGLPEQFFSLPSVPSDESLMEVSAPESLVGSAPLKAAFDPLTTLLSGRLNGVYDEDGSSETGQAHISSEVEEYLCFMVADEKYALSIMAIKEIIKPREVTEVPRMPDFISGVISLRGVIIPVMDMRLRLSLPVGESTGRERVIVLRTNAGFCGVLVDEVIQVVRMNRSAIEAPPAVLDGIDREFVNGLGRVDNRMLILLNLESILDLGIH